MADDDGIQVAYKWEQGIQASWESVQEDAEGRIIAHSTDREKSYRAKRKRLTQSIRRGLVRFMVVAVDSSSSALANDYRPSRLEASKQAVCKFIQEFFDQNPISQLATAIARDRIAERITDLSGNPKVHIHALRNVVECKGLSSLQNTVNLALNVLRHVPNYGHRELLILFSSLSTYDPGNIFQAIDVAREQKLRISVVCLAAEVFIARQLAELTGGSFHVALDVQHLSEILQSLAIPPPDISETSQALVTDFIHMGFPKRSHESSRVLAYEGKHLVATTHAYVCPRCNTRSTDLPTQCPVCTLQLNSSAHIARSHNHLFPVPSYQDHTVHCLYDVFYAVPGEEKKSSAEILAQGVCLSSRKAPTEAAQRGGTQSSTTQTACTLERCRGCYLSLLREGAFVLRCPACLYFFCVDCDLFVHDSLHNCPGCC